ncbi:putative mitochondrial protein, partial [Mucuna pruriens]
MRQLLEKCYNMKIHHDYYTLIDKNGKSITNEEKILEIVHLDLCTVKIPTHGDNKLEYTFFKYKLEACNAFKTFKVFIDKQSRCIIKALRIDSRWRTNKCLENFGRKQLLLLCIFLERCLTKSVCDKTPKKAWSGRKPSIRHLRVFGCITYAHAYKLYKIEIKKVIISRDMTFEEKSMWDWSSKSQKGTIMILDNYEENKRQNYFVDDDNNSFNKEIINFVLFVDCEPVIFEKVSSDENWRKTWMMRFVLLRRMKWVYMTKYNPNGEIDYFKARLVTKGYKQKLGIEYFEVFTLVSRLGTIYMIISLLTQNI